MRQHCAQIVENVVVRVIVGTPEWAVANLGGEWVVTDKRGESGVNYCGPGYGYDAAFPERFAPQWVMPAPETDTGEWSSYPKGAVVAHNGSLWKSTVDNNVWMPGVSAWHNQPEIEGVLPIWIQPTGSHDAYPIGFEVTHNGSDWRCTEGDGAGLNSWEPGVFGWTVIT